MTKENTRRLNASQQKVVDAAKKLKKSEKRSAAIWFVLKVGGVVGAVSYVFYDHIMKLI